MLNAKGRVSLMKRLQREEDKTPMPAAAAAAPVPVPVPPLAVPTRPIIPTPCLLLSNMFDPAEETNPNFHLEIQDDVASECARFGQLLHIFVDASSKVCTVSCACLYLVFFFMSTPSNNRTPSCRATCSSSLPLLHLLLLPTKP